MIPVRAIPCLLLKGLGLVKTVRFKDPTYLGDPINIVRIFNDKEVDELVFLDIAATLEDRPPPFRLLEDIASECFMPLGYGGGVRSIDDMRTLFGLGIEKVVINSHAAQAPEFIREASDQFGSQSVIVSIDVKKRWLGGHEVSVRNGTKATGRSPVEWAVEMQTQGAGELLLNSIDRDGMMAGYDLDLIRRVTDAVSVPVVACGGAGNVHHLGQAVREGGASAAGAGSLFVFQGPHRAVLISYPPRAELQQVFGE